MINNILTRQIDSLNESANRKYFNQICAVRQLQEDLEEIVSEQVVKDNLILQKNLREIQQIAASIEKPQHSVETNKYLMEYVVVRLKQLQKVLLNEKQ